MAKKRKQNAQQAANMNYEVAEEMTLKEGVQQEVGKNKKRKSKLPE